MKKLLYYAIALCLITACKKGDTGTPGTNGTNGSNGNANVQTINITVHAGTWTAQNTGWYVNEFIPQITQSIIDSGLVMVYNKSGLIDVAMPYTFYSGGNSYSLFYSVGLSNLEIDFITNNAIQQPNFDDYFKIVIASSHARMKNPDVKKYSHDN